MYNNTIGLQPTQTSFNPFSGTGMGGNVGFPMSGASLMQPPGAMGLGPAGMYSPSNELRQDTGTGATMAVMQAMMLFFTMSILQQMQQMIASLSGGLGGPGGTPMGMGQPSFGSRGSGPSAGGSSGNASAPSGGGASSGNSASPSGSSGKVGPKTGNLVNIPGGRVDSSIADNVKAMTAAAKKDGVTLKISSSTRTRAEQERLYAAYKNGTGNLAAKPGTSNHESGLAIDFANTPGAWAWLKKNSEKFGLKNLPSEPWHYSTTGR